MELLGVYYTALDAWRVGAGDLMLAQISLPADVDPEILLALVRELC